MKYSRGGGGGYSFDLIYCDRQTLKSWSMELKFALNFAKSHLALYQLTIERGTAFLLATEKRNSKCQMQTQPPNNMSTRDILSYAGLTHCEVSNHSKPEKNAVTILHIGGTVIM